MSVSRSTSPQAAPVSGLHKRYLEAASVAPSVPRRKLLIPSTLDRTVTSSVIPGPDIQWNPSYSTYQERIRRLATLYPSRPAYLPKGYSQTVEKPWVWTGSRFSDESSYVVQLQRSDILEIETALAFFKNTTDGSPANVSRATFPLPNLHGALERIAMNIHSGFGFNVIRGLDPKRYSSLDNVLIYLGITSYVAEKRGVQDSSGNMLIHVKDLGRVIPDSELRQSPYARNAQPFHNDVCDILAMYVQEQAAEGGESYLASAAQIYNDIAAKRPDVIHVLADDSWIFDKHKTPAYWNTRALLFNFDDKSPAFCFSRRPITGSPTSPRSPGVPPMTEIQAEALDMVHFTGVKHQLSMRLQRGDIQLINNLAVFHARNGFRDSTAQRRHILRLWLRNEELAWKTPQGLQRTWFEKYGDSPRRKLAKWNIEPGTSRQRVLYRSDSCS
ncbi:Clavaminate synthase-like protein [Delitschia confertaspora ATCC 74209]|uniref:Clavaminate synthase-like protein n=1 Tax=Delitschia confertaspora ATCC 74209 TaxID=1513339 RepID=A0A9P4MXA8_9PLEO|nr:Clavaminate synthase-like protein [Delitschia confertaspora ATCC 74209]